MKKFYKSEIVGAMKGELQTQGGSDFFTGISIDSRKIKNNELFIAIKGDRVDGHCYIKDAIEKGARGIIFSETERLEESYKDITFIKVKDSVSALQDLASHYRRGCDVPVVCITGSNGKTTTKEMLYEILTRRFNILKSPGNFNNHLGLPLSLLPIRMEHEIAILEMGMSSRGEIERLCEIAMPSVGIITNVALSHSERFKNIKGIAEAKAELLNYLQYGGGCAILNGDDDNLKEVSEKFDMKKVFFGLNEENNIKGKVSGDEMGLKFILLTDKGDIEVGMSVVGKHNIYNALAAAACAFHFGMKLDEVKEGLETFKGIPQRMELKELGDGMYILNDCYNSNPLSLKRALEFFSRVHTAGRKIALLADMLELGDFAYEAHEKAGGFIAISKFDHLITIGELGKLIADSAVRNGMARERVKVFNSNNKAAAYVAKYMESGDWLMVKGSRGMHLEEVVDKILSSKK